MADRRVQFATDHEVGGKTYKKGQTCEIDGGVAASLIFAGVARDIPTPKAVAEARKTKEA